MVESSGTLLVPLVEEGWTDKEDSVVLQTVQRYVEEMKRVGVDTVIMGCTHFPVLAEAISEVMGQDVFLVNMGVATANAVRRLLEETDALNEGLSHADHKFFVSDRTAAFESTASVLLGEKIDNFIVEQVDINKL